MWNYTKYKLSFDSDTTLHSWNAFAFLVWIPVILELYSKKKNLFLNF